MAGKRKANEAGSSNGLRGDVLCVLGVLKVATADQIQRLASPHLSYRHTLKKTAALRKEARTAPPPWCGERPAQAWVGRRRRPDPWR
ncbi:hypothetical protein [Streptomyces sp. NPDC055105]|uniref:hypothetical protein n=1 Tax=Streptomyces sp. NPDC055105 TaxID=3365719 RepID=UPI0037D47143